MIDGTNKASWYFYGALIWHLVVEISAQTKLYKPNKWQVQMHETNWTKSDLVSSYSPVNTIFIWRVSFIRPWQGNDYISSLTSSLLWLADVQLDLTQGDFYKMWTCSGFQYVWIIRPKINSWRTLISRIAFINQGIKKLSLRKNNIDYGRCCEIHGCFRNNPF